MSCVFKEFSDFLSVQFHYDCTARAAEELQNMMVIRNVSQTLINKRINVLNKIVLLQEKCSEKAILFYEVNIKGCAPDYFLSDTNILKGNLHFAVFRKIFLL